MLPKILLFLTLLSGTCLGQQVPVPSVPQCTDTENSALDRRIQDLQKQIAEQDEKITEMHEMIYELLNPPPQKHRKLKKTLTVVDHLGSAASILSILGVMR